MKALLFLTLAHYLADYPLQGDFLSTMKGKFKYLMFCHCLIWTGCVAVGLEYFGLFEWWKIAFLFVGPIPGATMRKADTPIAPGIAWTPVSNPVNLPDATSIPPEFRSRR